MNNCSWTFDSNIHIIAKRFHNRRSNSQLQVSFFISLTMDLAAFLTRSQHNGTINAIANGFENSQFSQDIPDCGIIVKDILDKLNKATPKRIEIPTVNGAISNNSLQGDPKKNTANSFSMEFNTICNNLLAICGYEISYNLSILLSLKNIIGQYIEALESSEDYDAIINNVTVIRNIFKRESLDVKIFDSPFITSTEDDSMVFRFDSELKPLKEDFFDNLSDHIIKNQERKNQQEARYCPRFQQGGIRGGCSPDCNAGNCNGSTLNRCR